ncbi:MAG: adenine phosphoribosyltransferase [Spirochaetia bacterium]|nr:adenine phosphoribosyltransferase [Spirochaetia bacterium]
MYYTMEIAGVRRDLELFPINETTCIAAFIMFGDVEITQASAAKLLDRAPDFDIIFTAEAKSIPLAYEMAKLAGMNDYVIARKAKKMYMKNIVEVEVASITTAGKQHLYLGQTEVDKVKGKRVLIVDDVISTGSSLKAMEELVKKAGGNIVGKMAVLAEGDAMDRPDITALHKLPLFNQYGKVKE